MIRYIAFNENTSQKYGYIFETTNIKKALRFAKSLFGNIVSN